MPPSPICLVSDNGGPFNPTLNGLDVNPGDPIAIILEAPAGVTNWYLQVGLVIGSPPVAIPGTGTDELQVTPPTLVGTAPSGLVTGGPTSTVTIAAFPPAGSALLLSSTVTGGFGQITTTFALFTPTLAGYRVGASGMTREGSNTYGWTPLTNAAIRHIGSGSTSDVGAVHPRTISNVGEAGASTQQDEVEYASVYYTSNARPSDLVYDGTTRTINMRSFGPYLWGTRSDGGQVFRFDLNNNILDVIPLNDIAPGAEVPGTFAQGGVVLDNDGNAWTLEVVSNTLVQIQAEPPAIIATFQVPHSPKNFIAFDSTHNQILLIHGNNPSYGINGKIQSFSLATHTFSADVSVGPPGGNVSSLFFAGGFAFAGGLHLGQNVYKINPVTLATVGTATFAGPGGAPYAYAYLANGGTPKLFVTTLSNMVVRIDVTTMTFDASFNVGSVNTSLAFNPNDNTLWVADTGTSPAAVWQLPTPLAGSSTFNFFRIDTTPNSDTASLVWDPFDGTFDVTSQAIDRIYFVTPTGSTSFQYDIAGAVTPLGPGTPGQVLTTQGPGVAPSWATSAGGFSDNAAALRVAKKTWDPRSELGPANPHGPANPATINLFALGIGLTDAVPNFAGQGLAVIGDSAYFTGYDGTGPSGVGALFGLDLYTQTSLSPSFTRLHSYGDGAVDLIGVRGQDSTQAVNVDYLFGIFPHSNFAELGTVSTPPVTYTTTNNIPLPSSPVRACYLAGGSGNTPAFAISAANGHIYIVDYTGALDDVFTTGDTPSAMFYEAGFLWVVYTTAGTLNKFRVTLPVSGTPTLTLVQTITLPVASNPLDTTSDGRYAWVLLNNTTVNSYDLQTGSPGPVVTLNGLSGTQATSRLVFDGVGMYVSTSVAGLSITRFDPVSGNIMFEESTGSGSARGLAVDSTGTLVAGLDAGQFYLMLVSGAFEDRNFNSIRNLNRPLLFAQGGRQQGQEVVFFGSFTLTPSILTALCVTSSGSSSITSPTGSSTSLPWVFSVVDVGNNASVNNITVTGVGGNIEDPNAPGTYSASVLVTKNGQAVTWEWSPALLKWYVKAVSYFLGVNTQQGGTPTTNNPHSTLNFTGAGVTVADAGGGVATVNIPGSSAAGFTDNATALRARQQPWLRRNELLTNLETSPTISTAALGIPTLTDNGAQIAGPATTLSDKFFYVGTNGVTNGALVGVDLFVPQAANPGPLHNYGDSPVDLIGVRGTTSTGVVTNRDYIFGAFPNSGFVELGFVTGSAPSMGYTQVYHTATPSAPVRACSIGGGGGDFKNFNGGPDFFFSAANGQIYFVAYSGGGIFSVFTTGDTPGAMFVDDAGFLWVAYQGAQTLNKFSINLTLPSITLISSINIGVTALDMIYDGRFARILANTANIPTIYSWDTTSGAAGPTIVLPGASTSATFRDPRDLFYDAVGNNVWVADQNNGPGTIPIFAINATTHSGSFLIPTSTIGNASRRVIGDANYIYVSNGFNFNRYLLIINRTTGVVVGQCDVGVNITARDQTLDGAGNIYIVARNHSGLLTNSNVKKFSIAAALASYPVPVTATVTTPVQRGYHVCAFDPVSGTVYAGTQNETGTTESLVSLNTSTLAEIAHFDFVSTGSNYPCVQFLLAAAGSIWASTGTPFGGFSGNLFRVNPGTFPAGGSLTNITTAANTSSGLGYDATFNTILVGDENNTGTVVSRVSIASNTMVSSWSPGTGSNSSAIFTPSAIWITTTAGAGPLAGPGVELYTTGVGTETPITAIDTVTLAVVFGGRLLWDGVSIYAVIQPPPGV